MTNQTEMNLQVVELPQELAQVAQSVSGITKDKADEHLMAFAPFMTSLTQLSQEMESLNFDNPSDADAKKARDIRLKLVPNRTAAEKVKDERKKTLLAEGNLIQAAFNVIKNASQLKEESCAKIEKFKELQEKARIAELTAQRMEEISKYNSAVDPTAIGTMSEETYSAFLKGLESTYWEKLEAERLQREAEEKAAEIRRLTTERMNAIRSVYGFLTPEESELTLGEMTEESFNSLVNALNQRCADFEAEQERMREEAEQLRKEKERLEAEAKQAQEEAERVRKEAEAKQKAAEAELRAKEAEEARLKAEAEAKAKAEEKARKAAERKANNAPDATKIQEYVQKLSEVELRDLKTEEGQKASENIQRAFKAFLSLVNKEIDSLS